MIYALLKLKKNRKKHRRSKKHKYYYTNLILNKYIVNKDEFNNFGYFFKSHYIHHKKKFNSFNVLIVCKLNGEVIDEIKLPNYMVITKKYVAFGKLFDGGGGVRPCYEYIDDYFFINDLCDEINIIFLSDFRDMTFYHYMNQPMSKLTRKLIINLLQNQNDE